MKKPSSSGSSGGDHTVSVDADKHGTVTVSPKRADKGDTVTITVKPDKGYELDELTVTDKSGDTIKIKDKGNGKFTFTMPGRPRSRWRPASSRSLPSRKSPPLRMCPPTLLC